MKNSIYVLYANIVSNALLPEKLDDQHIQRVMSSMQRQMTATAEALNGEVVKSAGEVFMCHFSNIDDALNGAADIMRAVEFGTFPDAWQFSVRAGLCASEEILLFDGWAQLSNLARPHQILISSHIAAQIPDPSAFKARELPAVRVNTNSSPLWEFQWRESVGRKSAAQTPAPGILSNNHPAFIIQFDGYKRIIQREGDTISIGRDSANDIVIDEDIVSRHHAHITMRNSQAVLTDQSTNGTYVFPAEGKPVLLLRDQTVLSENGKISFAYANGSAKGRVIEYVVLLEQ